MTVQVNRNKTSVNIETVHDNTSQELINITDDKLKLILKEHLEDVESEKAWQMPFGLGITIIIVFCTADFKSAFSMPADTWRAVFLILGVGCLVWLVFSIVKRKLSKSLDDLMDIIKNKS